MEDVIAKIIEIDNNAKKITENIKKKEEDTEKYIQQEISIKQAVLESEYKKEIEEKQIKYNKELEKRKQIINQNTDIKIKQMQEKFNQKKEQIQMKIISDILKKVN